ncbi:uL15 family ribosomal protein [Candidatus Nitrososphaera sp. FF02]|uniref:uL15 family ribosomal protein n=1 Tax=Candidatus Nitrososphaera sp. FF02 TaxID=3398226 RepID=UPI0039E988CA
MATRFRKSRRQRGSRYCGWGQVGQHRQAGSRGGIGGAGKHKHFWIRTVIEEPDHFGHDPFNSFNRNIVGQWINVRDLDAVFAKYGKADDKGKVVLDLTALGYDKLLGGGKISGAYTIKVGKVSEGAKAKIVAAGGEVIANEHDSE